MASRPKPPKGLGAAGKGLWSEVHKALPSRFEFDEREREILSLAAHQADDLARLEKAFKESMMVKGSQGQPVLHPAVAEARQARWSISRLLIRLDIPASKPAAQPHPAARPREAAAR